MQRAALLVGLILALLSVEGSAEQMRVTADGVNVRSGPDTRYEIVCQVDKGDLLTVRRTEGEWSEIAPPASAKLWVYAELIDSASVTATRIQIRSGPGISYRPVGKLESGQQVVIEESVGEWVRIAPPAEAAVWINSQFLESPTAAVEPVVVPDVKPSVPPSAPRASTRPEPVVTQPAPPPEGPVQGSPRPATPKPAMPAAPTVQDADPSDLPVALRKKKLDADKQQGEQVELTGELRSSGAMWGKLSPYRLVGRDERGMTVTICYVLGNTKQLASIEGCRVALTGRQYWVRRVRYPGVRPDIIRVQR